jgi:putative serine protease PepD
MAKSTVCARPGAERQRLAAILVQPRRRTGAAAAAGAVIGGVLVALTTSDSGDATCRAMSVADGPAVVVTIPTRTAPRGTSWRGHLSGGYILTNDHVISSRPTAERGVRPLQRRAHRAASIVGRDTATDLAAIKADDGAAGFADHLDVLAAVRVGQPVVALVRPLGLTARSPRDRERLGPLRARPVGNGESAHLIDALQTRCRHHPGNSGGALVDCDGKLIGINTAIATVPNDAGETAAGVSASASPSPRSGRALAQQLIDTGQANHPTFGLEARAIESSTAAASGERSGLYVTRVAPAGPAAQAGIRPGDIITELDGAPATRVDQLTVLTLTKKAGDTVAVTYTRDGRADTTKITLAADA